VRLREDETIELVDGAGSVAQAVVLDASAKACRVRVETVTVSEHRSRLGICFALPKPTALEFIVRRCTELGVESFQPLVTHYSMRPHSWNEHRWQKILAEVCKQCEEPYFPKLLPPQPLVDWLSRRDKARPLVFCHENERDAEARLPETASGVDLLTGSEGGWDAPETERLLEYGVIPFGLGRNRLRAETAALVAATLLKQRLDEI
jgi:16S rRNA (uracil1498-N3)-methyltransferase